MRDRDAASPDLAVIPVRSRQEAEAFVRLPYALYRNDAAWVPPLLAEERGRWDPKHNASLTDRPFWRFLAVRNGQVIGRIAVSLDSVFASRWCAGAGLFGFFECTRDFEAATQLVAAAEHALIRAGAKQVVGPVNLTTQEEVGCMTQGYGDRPRLLSPYNPEYYPAYLESLDYRALRSYRAYRWTPACEPSAGMVRIIAALRRRTETLGVTLRGADPRHWRDEAYLLHGLYNACFDKVWAFTPISWPEFLERAKRFRSFYRPELILIAEQRGDPIGFGVVLPDVNAVLQQVGGRLFPFGWLTALRAIPRLSVGRFLLMGVRPDFAGHGLAALIADEMAVRGRHLGMTDVELSLVDTQNRRMTHVIEAAGCKPVKTYTLYAKPLAQSASLSA